jgi:hypothetical protein
VQESKSQAPQVPPDVARYLSGAPPESQQFDFLIGDWGGEMLMSATGKDPAGNVVKTKIRFFHIAKHRFEWESQVSRDDGKTWSKTATLLASRATQ